MYLQLHQAKLSFLIKKILKQTDRQTDVNIYFHIFNISGF